jgi:hypothetical protein
MVTTRPIEMFEDARSGTLGLSQAVRIRRSGAVIVDGLPATLAGARGHRLMRRDG